ncbi:lipopolysaccharide biosynthesis protein [Sphingomicrobium lutaoense]|uniref:O-antigen/teichoic acid export membrane protein n=1 Tax=Sphingomicrobium lutaoense TaxID=515949 RepID=A0A839YYG5_9SPHN|nr:hypothetical protein [Sphingomicrobium lutaoense]MBB3763520.1 O-antigen/teichoic acid export membrane protein [Sphingomicrobium lutaoense]
MIRRIASTGLRAVSLGTRMLLIVALAHLLPPAEVARFALYSSALLLISDLLPLDSYAAIIRQLLGEKSDLKGILQRYFGLLAASALSLGLPVAWLYVSATPALGSLIAVVMAGHILLEILSANAARIAIALGAPLRANLLIFLRTAAWVFPALPALYFQGADAVFEDLLLVWAAGSALAALYGGFLLQRLSGQSITPRWDAAWTRALIRSVGWFFAGTVLYRAIIGLDRLIVERLAGTEVLAVYAVLIALAMGILSLLEAGVSAFHYPEMVKDIRAADWKRAHEGFRRFVRVNLLSTGGTFAVALGVYGLIIDPLLPSFYQGYSEAFAWLLVGTALFSASMPYHYALFGLDRDRHMLAIYATGLVAMVGWAALKVHGGTVVDAAIMPSVALSAIALGRFVLGRPSSWPRD